MFLEPLNVCRVIHVAHIFPKDARHKTNIVVFVVFLPLFFSVGARTAGPEMFAVDIVAIRIVLAIDDYERGKEPMQNEDSRNQNG